MTRKKWLIAGGVILLVLLVAGAIIAFLIYQRLNEDPVTLDRINGDLAFMSDRNDTWDIYMLSPDDADADNISYTLSNVTASTDKPTFFHNFIFEGKVVNLFSINDGHLVPAIVKADGSDFKTYSNYIEPFSDVIKNGYTHFDPAWSPDGEQLVFIWIKGFSADVFVSDTANTEQTLLSDEGETISMPAWSPDGSRVVFTVYQSGDQDVYIADVDSGELTRLTEGEYACNPVWSLDGETIMYATATDDQFIEGEFDLMVMDADEASPRKLEDGDVFEGDPNYSPDGTQVAYMSNESGTWQIYLKDIDGDAVEQLTADGSNNMYPAWRPSPTDG